MTKRQPAWLAGYSIAGLFKPAQVNRRFDRESERLRSGEKYSSLCHLPPKRNETTTDLLARV